MHPDRLSSWTMCIPSWHWAMWASVRPRNKDIRSGRGIRVLQHLAFRQRPKQQPLFPAPSSELPLGLYRNSWTLSLKSVWLYQSAPPLSGCLPVVNDDDNESWLCSCHHPLDMFSTRLVLNCLWSYRHRHMSAKVWVTVEPSHTWYPDAKMAAKACHGCGITYSGGHPII